MQACAASASFKYLAQSGSLKPLARQDNITDETLSQPASHRGSVKSEMLLKYKHTEAIDLSEHPAGTTLKTVWMFRDGTCTSSKPLFFKTADSAPLQNPTPLQSSLSLVQRVARHSTMNTFIHQQRSSNRDHATGGICWNCARWQRQHFCHSRRILGLRELFYPSGPTSTLHYNRTPMHASTTRVCGVRQVRILLYPKIPPRQREESVRDRQYHRMSKNRAKRMKDNMRFKLANTVEARMCQTCDIDGTQRRHNGD